MARRLFSTLSALLIVPFLTGLLPGQDITLSTAGAPYAPLDVSKRAAQDPYVPLSRAQRRELLGEFTGLVHVGLKPVAFEQWKGREMADCAPPENDQERWTYKCEIITGQGNGYYFFYPTSSGRSAILQQLDVRIHASDSRLLDDFRKPVQELFGAPSYVEKPFVAAKPVGRVRHWNTGNDLAVLFLDRLQDPAGCVRFVWRRSSLVASGQSQLNTDN